MVKKGFWCWYTVGCNFSRNSPYIIDLLANGTPIVFYLRSSRLAWMFYFYLAITISSVEWAHCHLSISSDWSVRSISHSSSMLVLDASATDINRDGGESGDTLPTGKSIIFPKVKSLGDNFNFFHIGHHLSLFLAYCLLQHELCNENLIAKMSICAWASCFFNYLLKDDFSKVELVASHNSIEQYCHFLKNTWIVSSGRPIEYAKFG